MTLYSTKDAAKEAGVSLSTLRTYVRYGQIHPEKVGVGYVFTDTHIQQIKGVLKSNRSRRQQGLNDYLDTPLIEAPLAAIDLLSRNYGMRLE